MKRVFLLGGYDLEMKTIKEFLEESEEHYFDKQLGWNTALLSKYRDVLDQYIHSNIILYGIELRTDIEDLTNYPNYKLIDHHNEQSYKPAAIIQIAQLLSKSLTRFQQLVAANDSGYIPAMEQLEATKEEINEIRYLDRQAQGVTANDERLAEQAIANHLSQYDGLTVVRSETPRFSAICDRLYPYHSLLIYSEEELMFYGKEVEQVIRLFSEELETEKFFYGGGENGFTGIAAKAVPYNELENMKDRIIKTISTIE